MAGPLKSNFTVKHPKCSADISALAPDKSCLKQPPLGEARGMTGAGAGIQYPISIHYMKERKYEWIINNIGRSSHRFIPAFLHSYSV